MKNISNKKWAKTLNFRPIFNTARKLSLMLLFAAGIQSASQAQAPEFTKPSWWFGVAGAGNFNFYQGSTQRLTSTVLAPVAFHSGFGVGLYVAPLVEFHRPTSNWGFMLQAGYDGRSGKFDRVKSPCNCPRDLSTNLSYITVEPSLRFAPFKSSLYFYLGPRLAYNLEKSFIFKQGTNPDYPDQVAPADVKGDLSSVKQTQISMQVGAGYDIRMSKVEKRTQWVLSPFVAFHPYFGQEPRSIESWNITTVRAGAALKLGTGRLVKAEKEKKKEEKVVVVTRPEPSDKSEAKVIFTVNSPENIALEHRVRETFPLRNYVFFNLGSTEIPDRYILLNKSQVKDFKEDQLEVHIPKHLSGRSSRQMIVYYNLLNIVGDRMGKNPESTIKLVGSSESGPEDGTLMAESVKTYLVDIFGISPTRIAVEGRTKPKIPSVQPGATGDLELHREGDRRVSIESTTPAMLMEFQSGPDAPLKPVEITTVLEAPLDSYVSFNASGSNVAFTSWSMEIKDSKGEIQYFGPYAKENVTLSGKSILGTKPDGDYTVTMIGQTKTGKTVRKDTNVHMVLWKPAVDEQAMRFSIIYEFNNSTAIAMYDKYLTEVVIPKIPIGSVVMVHGYTDIIGDVAYNQKLSLARATDVSEILNRGLKAAGRNDVKIDIYGFGEDPALTQFDNNFPEERFYNRTVIIDIVPKK